MSGSGQLTYTVTTVTLRLVRPIIWVYHRFQLAKFVIRSYKRTVLVPWEDRGTKVALQVLRRVIISIDTNIINVSTILYYISERLNSASTFMSIKSGKFTVTICV